MSALGSFTPKVVFRQGEREYLAKAFGPDQVPGKTAWGYAFVVSSEGGGETEHIRGVSSYLWEDSAEIAALGSTDESRKPFLCRAIIRTGFRYLQECLAHGAEIEPEVFCVARDRAGIQQLAEAAQRKGCEYRTAARRGYICELALESGVADPLTTTARCNECGFPEVFYRCRHLRGGMVDVRDLRTPQLRFEPICDNGKGLRDPEECLRRECYEPFVVDLTPREETMPLPQADYCPFSRARSCRVPVNADSSLVFVAGSASEQVSARINAVEEGIRGAGMDPYFATNDNALCLGQDAFCEKICRQIRCAAFCVILLDAPTHEGVPLHSPNVYYEFGLMKAFGKTVVPMLDSGVRDTKPFDVQLLDVRLYDPDRLREDVQKLAAQYRVEQST